MTIRPALKVAVVALCSVLLVLTTGVFPAAAISGGGCRTTTVQAGWKLRPCINYHGSTIGYDGYVTRGQSLQGCQLRLFPIDDYTGTVAANVLTYPCNYGTYLPGGGFIGYKGHCYETILQIVTYISAEETYSYNKVCV